MSAEDSFIGRWSRRKRGLDGAADPEETAAIPAATPAATETAPPPAAEDPEPQTPEEEFEALERLGLPDPSGLDKDDDFTAYLADHVPEWLRRKALHRLWRSDPVLANLDGLNDYDEDFTHLAQPATELLKSAWQAGRGYVDAVEETEAEPEPEKETIVAKTVPEDDQDHNERLIFDSRDES